LYAKKRLEVNQNKQRALDYSEQIWNKKNLKEVELNFAAECRIHSPLGEYQSPKQMLQVVQVWQTAFPDLKVKHLTPISEDERVAVQWSAEGTHLGEFQGHPPTGKKVQYTGTTVYEFLEGKISQYWAYVNVHSILNQLGTKS
jgi:steroid delta-isomerase-like uncharacterized protein